MDPRNNVYFFDNTKLIDAAKNMGQMKAAQTIQKLGVNGQELMEMFETDYMTWKLTQLEQKVLNDYIAQINPNRFIDPKNFKPKVYKNVSNNAAFKQKLGEVLQAKLPYHENKSSSNERLNSSFDTFSLDHDVQLRSDSSFDNLSVGHDFQRKPHPIPRYIKKYRGYFKVKNYKKMKPTDSSEHLLNDLSVRREHPETTGPRDSFYSCSSSIELLPADIDLESSRPSTGPSSDYIYAPTIQQTKNNVTIERIKKYANVKNSCIRNTICKDNVYDEVIIALENLQSKKMSQQDLLPDGSNQEEIILNNAENKLKDENTDDEENRKTLWDCSCIIFKYSCFAGCEKIN